jgi:hypothetical protein
MDYSFSAACSSILLFFAVGLHIAAPGRAVQVRLQYEFECNKYIVFALYSYLELHPPHQVCTATRAQLEILMLVSSRQTLRSTTFTCFDWTTI